MAPRSQTNEKLFRRTVEALNSRDREEFATTHTTGVVVHDHDETFHGVEAAVEHEWTLYEAFPDMEYAVEDILTEDDRVAARWTVTGTHEGEFEGIPATSAEIEIPASGVFRIEDGRIAEVWLTYDRLGMLQQLGVTELPTE